jgi:hypothetical protein
MLLYWMPGSWYFVIWRRSVEKQLMEGAGSTATGWHDVRPCTNQTRVVEAEQGRGYQRSPACSQQ